jgi:hypothetical protein
MGMKENVQKYFDEIVLIESDGHQSNLVINKDIADKHLSSDEINILILFTTMMNYMNNVPNAETMDMAVECLKQLKEAGNDFPVSSKFINSIFNFDNVYSPLYDLLDLATTGRYRGENMSDDYRKGIIDSIIALRKFQRTHGLGDHEWEINYNTAINR